MLLPARRALRAGAVKQPAAGGAAAACCRPPPCAARAAPPRSAAAAAAPRARPPPPRLLAPASASSAAGPSGGGGDGGSPPAGAAPPRRVAVFVEPSPFTYVSGYKNRFCTMIRHLREAGCEVLVITTGAPPPPPCCSCQGEREGEIWAGIKRRSAFAAPQNTHPPPPETSQAAP